nr:iron dependent repressor, metal binding and dimerization domain protein [Maliibacterium massiliense]
MDEGEFRTIKGYNRKNNPTLTDAMEDYLEMICRDARKYGYARINHLAAALHVKPSSCSKMVSHLRALELVDSERYGVICPTQRGWEIGGYLLHRHDILHAFLCLLNQTQNETEQTEQLEHFVTERTLRNLERLIPLLERYWTGVE